MPLVANDYGSKTLNEEASKLLARFNESLRGGDHEVCMQSMTDLLSFNERCLGSQHEVVAENYQRYQSLLQEVEKLI